MISRAAPLSAYHPFGRCRHRRALASVVRDAEGFSDSQRKATDRDMDLVLTEVQRFIRDEARRLLADRCTSDKLRAVVESGTGLDAELWRTISGDLGWCAMTIPEADGGLGLGLTELVLLLEATGERLAAMPLWSTACLAAPLLMVGADAQGQAAWLPRIAAGEIAATVAFGRLDTDDPFAAPTVTATRQGAGYVLDGLVPQVTDLVGAGLVLVPARLAGGLALFALEPGAGHEIRQLEKLDGTRQIGALRLDALALPDDARVDSGALSQGATDATLAVANLGLAAEQVGVARGAMDLTLAYIAERVQFGRTIASFQAVKHRCAMLEVDLAEVRSLVHGAAQTADPTQRLLEAAGARALASDLALRAAEESIQLHGGVGFTWDYDPHLYFKRAQASRALLGSPEQHFERIARQLLDREVAA